MMRLLIANGQRTGVVRNLTVGEYRSARMEDGKTLIQVRSHKTSGSYALQLVLDGSLKQDMDIWIKGRDIFFKDAKVDYLFLSMKGQQLASNALAKISRVGVGGTVTDMRKAQYHLVRQWHKVQASILFLLPLF